MMRILLQRKLLTALTLEMMVQRLRVNSLNIKWNFQKENKSYYIYYEVGVVLPL